MAARTNDHRDGSDRRTRSSVHEADARAFLQLRRVALVGSAKPTAFAATVRTALEEHGMEVVAVDARADTAEGEAVARLADVPGELDGVVVMVAAEHAADVVRAALDRGVPAVWLFKGAGPGAVSDEAVRLCRDAGVRVVAGACPLMFLEPVGWVHRVHRSARRLTHQLVRS